MKPTTRFPIEAGHVLLFARAVLDDRADYYGPTAALLPVAPPTFTQALMHFQSDFEMRPRAGQLAPGIDAIGSRGTVFHAEQRFHYHRHARAGETLSATSLPGRTWIKPGRRGGNLTFSEVVTEFRDEAGDLVITSTSVRVETERVVSDD
ncbi:MAG: hypothetical protein JWO62_2337 [Acidimicrobiaceae bacterium]|nr:hypothetical protein [Acidimicrobiaceae bacterium]